LAADARRRLPRRLGRTRTGRPRVVSFWDGSRLAGRWFANHSIGGLGGPGDIVSDAYLAFDKNARWRNEPTGVVASDSDIIDNTSGLDQRFIPLLARGCTAARTQCLT
jgi:hypothetical protein